jgi:hypothetical protein
VLPDPAMSFDWLFSTAIPAWAVLAMFAVSCALAFERPRKAVLAPLDWLASLRQPWARWRARRISRAFEYRERAWREPSLMVAAMASHIGLAVMSGIGLLFSFLMLMSWAILLTVARERVEAVLDIGHLRFFLLAIAAAVPVIYLPMQTSIFSILRLRHHPQTRAWDLRRIERLARRARMPGSHPFDLENWPSA